MLISLLITFSVSTVRKISDSKTFYSQGNQTVILMKRTKTKTARERALLTNHEPIGTARQTTRRVTTETGVTSHVTTRHTRLTDPKTGRIRGEWITRTTKGTIDQAVITTGEISIFYSFRAYRSMICLILPSVFLDHNIISYRKYMSYRWSCHVSTSCRFIIRLDIL